MKNHHKGNPIPPPVAPKTTPDREEVARRAYQFWQDEGQPADQHEAHWFRAEGELASQTSEDTSSGDRS